MSTQTPEEFAKNGGDNCPVCGSTDITTENCEVSAVGYYEHTTCNICGSTWYCCYEVTGYIDLENGNEKNKSKKPWESNRAESSGVVGR
jgi:hypothetical protein